MAKQTGPFPLIGTFGNITYYEMNGKPYARKKSSLTKKKFMTHPNFENSRRSAARLALGSRIGSLIYNELFPGSKDVKKYREIAGEATKYLKEEYSEAEVKKKLRRKYAVAVKKAAIKKKTKTAAKKKASKPAAKKSISKKTKAKSKKKK